jgi:hypothetical protein
LAELFNCQKRLISLAAIEKDFQLPPASTINSSNRPSYLRPSSPSAARRGKKRTPTSVALKLNFRTIDRTKPSPELSLGKALDFAIVPAPRARLNAFEVLLMLLAGGRFKLRRCQLGGLVSRAFDLLKRNVFGRSSGAIFLNRYQVRPFGKLF